MASSTVTGNGFTDSFANFGKIVGSNSVDTMLGSTGADSLNGRSGNDIIDGGAGNDRLAGEGGEDSLRGGAGDDSLTGDANDDILDGGAGNDTLEGGTGDDILFAGAGDDVIDGGTGVDFVSYSDATSGITFSSTEGIAAVSGFGTDALTDVEGVIGTDFADTITAGSGIDKVQAGDGDDSIDVSSSTFNGELDGGAGNDSISLSGVTSGTATVMGRAGDDDLSGGDGSEKLDGGSGNDTLRGSAGDDTLDGGAGTADVLDYSAVTDDLTVNFGYGGGQQVMSGHGTDTLVNLEVLVSGSGDDTLTVSSSGTTVQAGAGNDTVRGGDGIRWMVARARIPSITAWLVPGLLRSIWPMARQNITTSPMICPVLRLSSALTMMT